MTRQKFDVNNLRVASPCPVGWNTMSGDERVRYCNLCKLNVYNISEMTAAEVQSVIAKSEKGICGRLYKRADGTVLTKDCPVGLRAYQKRASRMAGAALAAILGLFSVSFGQKDEEKSIDASKAQIVRTINRRSILTGKITDRNDNPAIDVDVTIFQSEDGERLRISANKEGIYQTPPLAEGIYTLVVGNPDSKYYQVTGIKINNDEQVKLDIKLDIEFGYVTAGFLEALPANPTNFEKLLKVQTEPAPEKAKKP